MTRRHLHEMIGTLTLTMRIHLISERPNPQMAPYLPAMVLVMQKDRQKPSQLKMKATAKETCAREVIVCIQRDRIATAATLHAG